MGGGLLFAAVLLAVGRSSFPILEHHGRLQAGADGLPPNGSDDTFGAAVAIHNYVLAVHTPQHDGINSIHRGAVRISSLDADDTVASYVMRAAETEMSEGGFLAFQNRSKFGSSLAWLILDLSGDGHTEMAVGTTEDFARHKYAGESFGYDCVCTLSLGAGNQLRRISRISGGTGGFSGGLVYDSTTTFGLCLAAMADLPGAGVVGLAVGAVTDVYLHGSDDLVEGTIVVLSLLPNGTVGGVPIRIEMGGMGWHGVVAWGVARGGMGCGTEWVRWGSSFVSIIQQMLL